MIESNIPNMNDGTPVAIIVSKCSLFLKRHSRQAR